MHLSPLLPLLLLPLTLASPIQPSLTKRNYVTRLLSRAGTFRSFAQVAPACAGEGCPQPTPEEEMCIERFGDSQRLRFPADPLNKTEVALGEDARTDVNICTYSTLVDERCVKYGVTDPWGISEKQAANEMKKYGFVGCPGTSDQLVHRVGIETRWSEKKVRRMMDLIAPGWDEAADDAIEEEKYQTKKKGGSKWGNGVWISAPVRQQPVVETRPYNIPLDVAVRYLPPAPIQRALVGCYGWTVAKRGETCPKIIKRLNMSLEKFLDLNPQVGGKGCPHLLSGYAYCTTTRAEADAALREKLGYPPQDVSFS